MPHRIIFKNFSHLVVAQTLYKIATFLMMIIIARYLGVDRFGRLSFALSFVWIFMFLSDLGLSELFIRDVARDRRLKERYINNILTLKIFLGVIFSAVVLAVARVFSSGKDEVSAVIMILGISTILDSFMYFFRSLFRMEEMMEYESRLLLAEGALKLAVIAAAVRSGLHIPGLILIAIAMFAVSLINFTINLVVFKARNPRAAFLFEYGFWLRILKSSVGFMSIAILTFLNFRVNIMALSLFQGDSSAGMYNANYRLIEQVLLIPIAFSAASLPAFSRMSGSLDTVRRFLRQILAGSLCVSFLCVAICYIFGTRIITIMYGRQFSNAGAYLGALSLVLIPFFIKSVLEKLLFSMQKQRQVLVVYILGVCLNAVLNVLLVPLKGINGASAGTVISECLMVAACFFVLKRSEAAERVPVGMISAGAGPVINESVY